MRPLVSLFIVMAVLTAQDARAAGHVAEHAPLQLCYEDVPQGPWTMPDGRGLNFELLKRVEHITGERFVIVRKPWARCVEETRVGRVDGMIGAADAPARRQFSVVPLQRDGSVDPGKALHQTRVQVFLRVGGQAGWDGKVLHNPRGVVITQRGYVIADLLRERGQQVNDSVKSADEALRLLVSGVADVAVIMEHAADALVREDVRFRGRITIAAQPYSSLPLFLMFSRLSYERDPARLEAVWSAIATVRASADYRRLEAAAVRRAD